MRKYSLTQHFLSSEFRIVLDRSRIGLIGRAVFPYFRRVDEPECNQDDRTEQFDYFDRLKSGKMKGVRNYSFGSFSSVRAPLSSKLIISYVQPFTRVNWNTWHFYFLWTQIKLTSHVWSRASFAIKGKLRFGQFFYETGFESDGRMTARERVRRDRNERDVP